MNDEISLSSEGRRELWVTTEPFKSPLGQLQKSFNQNSEHSFIKVLGK